MTSVTRPSNRGSRAVLVGVILGAIAAQGPLAASADSSDRTGTNGSIMTRSELSDYIGVALPEGAAIIAAEPIEGRDRALRAKLTMTPQERAALLEEAGMAQGDLTPAKAYLFGQDRDWWDPQAAGVSGAQTHLAPGRVLNVGVASGAHGSETVYIFWHHN